MKKKNLCRRKFALIIGLFIVLASMGTVCYSYFSMTGQITASTSLTTPKFKPSVSTGSYSYSNYLTYDSTFEYTDEQYAPGSSGSFDLNISFSEVDYDSYYKITYDRTNLPNNLKLYFDSNYTTEIDTIEGVQLKTNTNKTAYHKIYWKWLFVDDAESNTNDSLFMNKKISLMFNIRVAQKVENHALIVNNIEKPTGYFNVKNTAIDDNSGVFDFVLDFSNIDESTDYRVLFNYTNSNLHFYSDSEYQNEITSLSGSYDGVNKNITHTVYWKLSSGNYSSLNSQSLYYAVALGSW